MLLAIKKLFRKVFAREERRSFLVKYIPRGGCVAEIGVWKGDFSKLLLGSSKISDYYLIDPYEFMPQYPARMYGGKIAKSQADMDEICMSVRKSLASCNANLHWIRKKSEEAAGDIKNNSLDFLYIDGNHYYDGVLGDIRAYLNKVKIGGFVVFDDWFWKDDKGRTSVAAAVCTFLSQCGGALQLVEVSQGQGVFLVVRNEV